MSISVIIPSRNAENLTSCVEAVHKHEPDARVIVVDDGVYWDGAPVSFRPGDLIAKGADPFVFARNVNIGIRAAGRDDVIVLNDDAILETPGGFSRMRRAAQEDAGYGLIASTCNNVGNPNQWRQKWPEGVDELRGEPRMVCFVAVLIPRWVIEYVGLLDERFVGYGLDDDDYSLRVRNKGLKIGIHDGCYVDHGSLTSSYRSGPSAGGDFRPNLQLFIEKWGMDNWGRPVEKAA